MSEFVRRAFGRPRRFESNPAGKSAPSQPSEIRRPRVLFVEARVPALALGMGYGRSEIMVRALVKIADVDLFAYYPEEEQGQAVPHDFRDLEVSYGPEPARLEERLASRAYDAVYVCRPGLLSEYEKVLAAWKRGGGRVIYDSESLYTARDIAQRLKAESYAAIVAVEGFDHVIMEEMWATRTADVVIAVNEIEAGILRERLGRPVVTIGHHLPAGAEGPDVAQRSGLLFVGSLWQADRPNYEGLVWFLDHVWPKIRVARPQETFRIAGYVGEGVSLAPLAREGVACLGAVPDLAPEYARARVFIAPTRFAAGVPFKAHEAMSHGLPVVTSLLLGEQLAHEGDMGGAIAATVRDDGRAFADACLKLLNDDQVWRAKREAALAYMRAWCAPSALDAAVAGLMSGLPLAAGSPAPD